MPPRQADRSFGRRLAPPSQISVCSPVASSKRDQRMVKEGRVDGAPTGNLHRLMAELLESDPRHVAGATRLSGRALT
jgi:hypothetical protein